MKSIFFPFEQMARIFVSLQSKKYIQVIEVLLFLLISGIFGYYGSLFFTPFVLCSIAAYSFYYRNKKNIAAFGIIIVLFVGIVYNFITKYYNEDLNISSYYDLNRLKLLNPFEKANILNLYSADGSGIYYEIADTISKTHPKYFKKGDPPSSGGYENPNRVLLDPNGLGFVQEDIYINGDKIKEEINYCTPLYMEKLHILYNKNSLPFRNLKNSPYLSLGCNDSLLKTAISNSRIAVGLQGSATKILSSIVLSAISKDKPSINVSSITTSLLADAMRKIRNDTFDIVFFMAGQPVDTIQRTLKNHQEIGLIGIEPSVVDAINATHKSNYRYTDFSAKKDNSSTVYRKDLKDIPTLGSYSYLIANKKVKPFLIKKFVDELSTLFNNKEEIKTTSDTTRGKIDFFNFKDTYERTYNEKLDKTWSSLVIALVGGISLGTVILAFIFALVSSYFHDGFNNRLADIIKNIPDESIPNDEKQAKIKREEDEKALEDSFNNLTLSEDEKNRERQRFEVYYRENNYWTEQGYANNHFHFKNPYIKFNQKELIDNNIISGLSGLVDLRQDINIALQEGKINIEHFSEIQARIDSIMEKLRKSLFLRLNGLLLIEPLHGGFSIDEKNGAIKKLLLKYVTSNYLNFDDYKKLYPS